MARDCSKLDVFRLADALALDVFRLTSAFPPEERFGLTAQLRRAAVSAPANLMEGSERTTEREFLRFIDIAAGSASEARYLLSLARRLALAESPPTDELERRYDGLVRGLQNLRTALVRQSE